MWTLSCFSVRYSKHGKGPVFILYLFISFFLAYFSLGFEFNMIPLPGKQLYWNHVAGPAETWCILWRVAELPCLVFSMGLVVLMWDGWKDLLNPAALHQLPQISVVTSSLSTFTVLFWKEAGISLFLYVLTFRVLLALNYPELFLKKGALGFGVNKPKRKRLS